MTRIQANGLLLLAAMLWGSGNVAQQTVLDHIGPLLANGLKSAIAAAVILPLCLAERRQAQPLGRDGWRLALAVAVTFTLGTTCYQVGFGYTTVSNAGFLVNTATVITPFLAWTLLGQRPAALVWPAVLATFAGATLMAGGSPGTFQAGDVICLASALCFGLWMIALGEFVRRHGRAGWITVMQFVFAALVCTGAGAAFEPASLASVMAALPELLFLGVASTGLGYLLQAVAQRRTTASEAAVLVSAEAVFGAAAASLLLGEWLTPQGYLGALLIMLGILTLQLPRTFFAQGLTRRYGSMLM